MLSPLYRQRCTRVYSPMKESHDQQQRRLNEAAALTRRSGCCDHTGLDDDPGAYIERHPRRETCCPVVGLFPWAFIHLIQDRACWWNATDEGANRLLSGPLTLTGPASVDLGRILLLNKYSIFMDMASGGGASTLGWNNKDHRLEDFTRLTHRLLFLLAP